MALTKYSIGQLIELTTEINADHSFGPDDVRGMTITKQIIPTKANVSTTDISKFLIIRPGEFVFNPRTHGKHIGFGYNNTEKSFIISQGLRMNRLEDVSKESIIVRTTAAFSGKGYVLRVAFEDIQSNMANNRHILRRMIFADAAVVFVESHV